MLTRKQQIFVMEYLNCWNASEAARRAGYSEKTANSIGQENLTKPDIAAEIERLIAERGVKPPEVLDRLGGHARANIGDFFKESFRWSRWPLPTDEIIEEREENDPATGKTFKVYKCRRLVFDVEKMRDPQYAYLIRKFSDTKNGLSIELYDAQAALEKLGKALGVLRDNVTVNSEGSIEIVTRLVRKPNGEADS